MASTRASARYGRLTGHAAKPWNPPPLNIPLILRWADAYHRRTGKWPTVSAGRIPESPSPRETWSCINGALHAGARGLPGGGSLARVLFDHRGATPHLYEPRLTIKMILDWADEHHRRTGKWPNWGSGRIHGTERETWANIHSALEKGARGLPGGFTLGRLLHDKRGYRFRRTLPKIRRQDILAWADEFFGRNGNYPHCRSGLIPGTGGETWNGVEHALRKGQRGLPGGSSLHQFLKSRGRARVPATKGRPRLPVIKPSAILTWADRHRRRHGEYPSSASGQIPGAGTTWRAIDSALREGLRGLPAGSSLSRFLRGHGRLRGPVVSKVPLKPEQIVQWAEAFSRRHGHRPTASSGPVADRSTSWKAIDSALYEGSRGLPGSDSLARFLDRYAFPRLRKPKRTRGKARRAPKTRPARRPR
jgi:hypothetical protein